MEQLHSNTLQSYRKSRMEFRRQLSLAITFVSLLPLGLSFTVIMSDSGAPQNGLSNGKSLIKTDDQEQEAVYDIMRATGNDWATEIPDVCRRRWHGIECMPDKNNVYHVVSLSFGALSDDTVFPTCDPTRSHISPSITNLPHLRTLFFFRCFTNNPQPIPAFLGKLSPSLQTLVLRENGHTGSIPFELGYLNRLRVLDLHKNSLNGSIPWSLSRIGSLKSLDLSGNRLTGSIPEFGFPFLKVLDLNQNLITGPLPSSLGTCHSLIKLDLSHNRLTDSIPDSVNGLMDLTLMDLSYNRLSGPIPGSLSDLGSLQALILKGNPMDPQATIPANGFSGMKSLTILDLSSMNLHGSIPETLSHLPSLRVLHLERNHLNGSIPRSFKNLKNLSELRLNDNLLTGPVPFEREMVWRMKRKLRLHNNVGLCFESSSGFDEGGSDDGSGVGPCDAGARSDDKRTVQHLVGKVQSSSAAKAFLSDDPFSLRLIILLVVLIFV